MDRRSLLRVLAVGSVSGPLLPAAALALSATPNPLPDSLIPPSVVLPDQAKHDVQPFGDLRYYLEGATGELQNLIAGYLELKVGQTPHPPHTHRDEELMIFIAGHGELTLGSGKKAVSPGVIAFVPGGCLHGLVNTGTATLAVYYLKWIGR